LYSDIFAWAVLSADLEGSVEVGRWAHNDHSATTTLNLRFVGRDCNKKGG
jgi:hypothetical protein